MELFFEDFKNNIMKEHYIMEKNNMLRKLREQVMDYQHGITPKHCSLHESKGDKHEVRS